MQFHFHANQSHFHKNDFAVRLALKQMHNGTPKMAYSVSSLLSTEHKNDGPFLILRLQAKKQFIQYRLGLFITVLK